VGHAVGKPDLDDCLFREAAPLCRTHPGVDQRQLDIVEYIGAGQEIEGLEDEADLFVSDLGQTVLAERTDISAVKKIGPRGRHIEAADNVHQGRFPRSRGAHDRHVLVAGDAEGNPSQSVDSDRVHVVDLLDGTKLERHRLIPSSRRPP
jgi:hypothetical protein